MSMNQIVSVGVLLWPKEPGTQGCTLGGGGGGEI